MQGPPPLGAKAALVAGLVALLVGPGSARAAEPDPEAYDPFDGVEADGRIPGVERPDSLPNPERWRYVPEGRIKPGNVFERLLVSSFAVPFFFADSDIGVGAGIALTDIDFREQRRREFAGMFFSYTSKGQQNYSAVWRRWLHHVERPEGGVFFEERSFLNVELGYSKTLTRRFYGLGGDTEEGDETSFTDELVLAGVTLEKALPGPGDDWVLVVGAKGELHDLSAGQVGDVPSSDELFPELFDDADGRDLGWLVFGLRWDTRDSQHQPYSGFSLAATGNAALLQNDGAVGARWTVSGTKIFRVPGIFHDGGGADEEHPPTDTLAIGFITELTSGDLPFVALPSLGGSLTHRGYVEGRFRDRASWLLQVEHRFWVLARGITLFGPVRVERIGLAPFYEVGAVADRWTDLTSTRVRHSYGIGLRASLERDAVFRFDLGFSEEGQNFTARFGLSF